MQAPKPGSLGGNKRKEGLPPQGRATASTTTTFQPSFANRDMAVNKMYARFQERFG